MTNIDKFNTYVAEIFALLYSEFPKKTTINVIDRLKLNISFPPIGSDEVNRKLFLDELNEADLFLDSISWLIESGFLYGSVKNEVNVLSVIKKGVDLTLTPKGLSLLNLFPSSLEDKKSLGDELVDIILSGSKVAAGNIISGALTKFSSVNQLSSILHHIF